MKKTQVLCVTMHQKDFSKIKQMNITTDAILANQADCSFCWEMQTKDVSVKLVTKNERGVGKNRNTAIDNMYDDCDICLIADDDMRYVDNYAKIVDKAFSQVPEADALIFNIETVGCDMGRRKNGKIVKVRFYNCLNYGAVRIAIKREALQKSKLCFSELFGGGAPYSAGEDTLFIADMLKHGMKIYTYPETIASVEQNESSWFCGYNEKYLYDKGALFCALSKPFANLLCIQDLMRHPRIYKENNIGIVNAYRHMKKGIKGYKRGIPYEKGKNNE